jgi:hypothetical protein
LPTILSRMQKIHFGRLSDSEMLKAISGNIRSCDDLKLSLGRPGRAMRLMSDPIFKEAENYADIFLKNSLAGQAGTNRSKLIKELVEGQKEKPELLDRFFETLILKLRQNPEKNCDILKSILHRLFLIKSYNVNKRLQLEAI